MIGLAGCTACESCNELLSSLNGRLGSIADNLLYNIRYELGRKVDRELFALLTFYKKVLTDICNDEDCDCYTVAACTTWVSDDCPEDCNTGYPTASINHCICGCCPPLNPVCTTKTCSSTNGVAKDVATTLTKENIIERIKILIA